MRILIISDVPWSDNNSVGNTYTNIFENMKETEFANLYCKSGEPDSKIVKKYFQITEKELLHNLFGKKKEISLDDKMGELNGKEQKLYDLARTLRFQSLFIIRELIWKICTWKTKGLDAFLNEYKPDIIFSFCLESLYYNDVINYCRDYTEAKLILFFADDVYSYTKTNPLYLGYKYFSRKKMKEIANTADMIYGASPQLCSEYSSIFKKRITPLYKVCNEISESKSEANVPLRITYTGNLFYGRWKTMALIAEAIKEINISSNRVQFNIYTTGLTTKQINKALNIEDASQILGAIPYNQVKKVLKDSDIVLHVESFDKKEIKKTRLSFSTKIIDCMQSGSCLLAVGPEETASIKLLKDYNIALVVQQNDKEMIKEQILAMLKDNNLITNTAYKMSEFAANKHSLENLEKILYIPLKEL